MPKQIVNISDTVKTFQEKVNIISADVGWRGNLTTTEDSDVIGAINEHDAELGIITPAAMGTTAGTVSTAINELDTRLDSINDTLINSAKLHMRDSSATNTIKGGLDVHSNVDIGGNLQVDGTLTVDGVVNMKAGSNGSVTLGDANTDNVVFSADVNSHIIPNTDNTYDLGSNAQQWRDIHVHGTGNIDTVSADDVTVSNTLDVNTSATIATLKVEDLTNDRLVVVGTGGELEDHSGLTYNGSTLAVAGTLDVNTNATIASAKIEDLTDNRVVIVGTGGELEDHSGLTYSSNTLTVAGTLDVNTNATIASAKIEDLTNNRIVIAGTGGEIEDDANLTYDGTEFSIGGGDFTVQHTNGNTAIAGTLDVDTSATIASAKIEDLTSGRVVLAGTGGELQDNANLTYNGTLLTVTGNAKVTGTLDVDTNATIASAKIEDLTPGRLTFASTGGELVDDADLTYNTTTDTFATSKIDIGVQADLASAKVEDLTNNRVVIVGTGGELEDHSGFTFDGTNMNVGSTAIAHATGDTQIGRDLDVARDLEVVGDLQVGGNVTSTGWALKIAAETGTTDNISLGNTITFEAGEGINTTVSNNKINITGELATTTNKGVASFAAADFSITSGAVSIASIGNSQIDNSYVNIAAASGLPNAVNLGETFTVAAGEGIDTTVSGNTITVAGELATALNKGVASFSSDNFAVNSGVVSVKNNGIILGTETTGNYISTITGTADKITVTGSGSENSAVTIDLPDNVIIDNNLSVGNDLTVTGDFVIQGSTVISAHRFKMGEPTTGTPTVDGVISIDRGSSDSAQLVWSESLDRWQAGIVGDMKTIAFEDDSANFTQLSVDNNLIVTGNLEVRGTTTTVDTTNLAIADNLIVLNSNHTGAPLGTLRSGLEIERGSATNAKLQYNESTDQWEFVGPKTGTLAVTDDINAGTITISAGTDLSTGGSFGLNDSDNATVTINHSNITRSDTTTTASPAYGATFTAIDNLTTNARGHVTGVRTKTITIPASDNTDTIYTHPTYLGDDASIDTGALTGATVISDLDLNITTDTLGHVTDANATVATRTLTLANLGYTGATNANNYSLPLATNTVRGGIELFNNTDQSVAANTVTTTASRTYGLQLNSANQGVINVPWTDTVYSHPTHDGDDISIDTGYLTGAVVIADLDFNITTDGLGHVTDANATVNTKSITLEDVTGLTTNTIDGNVVQQKSTGAVYTFERTDTTPNDNNLIGQLKFIAEGSDDGVYEYAGITADISESSTDQPLARENVGRLEFHVRGKSGGPSDANPHTFLLADGELHTRLSAAASGNSNTHITLGSTTAGESRKIAFSSSKVDFTAAGAVDFTGATLTGMDDAIGQDELKSVVSLVIYNSAGTAVKTLYGAGS